MMKTKLPLVMVQKDSQIKVTNHTKQIHNREQKININ